MIYKVINDQVRDNLINEIKSRPVGYQVKIEDLRRGTSRDSHRIRF